MSHAALVWANLRRRPVHALMSVACVAVAFALYGLALGVAESFRREALARQATVEPQLLVGAIAVSAVGMALILLLSANAMAHAVRLRLHELGVLKALGFSNRRIIALVVAEAAVPCLTGAVLGLLAAQGLFAMLASMLPALAALPPPVYAPEMLAAAFVLAGLMALLSAALPALRIARMDAAEALAGGTVRAAPAAEPRETQMRQVAGGNTALMSEAGPMLVTTHLHLLRQIAVVTRIGLTTLPRRSKGALLIVAGVGAVVFVLLSFLSMAEGIRAGMLGSGDPTRVVLRAADAARLHVSTLPDGLAGIVATAPGIARAADGSALVDAETFSIVGRLTKRNDGEATGHTTLVGIGAHFTQMTPSFRLLSGRLPRAGVRELLAGTLAQRKFSSLDAGSVTYSGTEWRIVGTFTTGDWWDGYLVGHAAELKDFAAQATDSVIRAKLTSPEGFDAFRAAMVRELPATVAVERESDYYAGFWRSIPKTALYIAFALSGLIAAGTIAGVTQVMHSSLEERSREIATLRLLGFDGSAVAASVVLEAVGVATFGALAGAAIVWLWLDGFLYNGAWNVFVVTVNWHLLQVALGWALAIALISTLPVAVRTMRQSALGSLRDLYGIEEGACHTAAAWIVITVNP
jgi:putative ABC transport system permease protein